MKKYIILMITLSLFLIFDISLNIFGGSYFSDVPNNHWAYNSINQLHKLDITNGIGNNKFGLGKTITRAEFVSFLSKLMNWENSELRDGSFEDNKNKDNWYFYYIETAVDNGVITKDDKIFRPNDNITREEMAVMIVRALGYDELAKQLNYLDSPFDDVVNNKSYINIAKDFGIISGTGNALFSPNNTATREQVAVIMTNMYNILNKKIDFMNGFYAINSSPQMKFINNLNAISFGWSRLEMTNGNLNLNFTATNNNEYSLPKGYETALNFPNNNNRKNLLMIAIEDVFTVTGIPLSSYIISSQEFRINAVKLISNGINKSSIDFDGIVIDFENMKGNDIKQDFNVFLTELKDELDKTEKLMYVAVHPQRRKGQEYFDAYDYKTIGRLADKVILMAHDYNAKILTADEMSIGITTTPLAPIEEVYYALKMITDEENGIEDKNKILLQISFGTAQWKLKDGKVINEKPYSPNYNTLWQRIQSGVKLNYSTKYESPYVTFLNSEDNTDNIIWYEDSRSVSAKLKLVAMFNINGISIWRLGNIPDYKSENDNFYLDVMDTLYR